MINYGRLNKNGYVALIITLACSFGTFEAKSQVPEYVPTKGLLGWWPLDGNCDINQIL